MFKTCESFSHCKLSMDAMKQLRVTLEAMLAMENKCFTFIYETTETNSNKLADFDGIKNSTW